MARLFFIAKLLDFRKISPRFFDFRSKLMTRYFIIIAAICVLLLVASGCENGADAAGRRVELTESGFPKVMVGVWQAEPKEQDWAIQFNSDGSIPKMIIPSAGPVVLAEGGTSREGPQEGTFYIFEMGPCEARYEPQTGMLKVKIVVDYFRMQLTNYILEGRIEDYVEGPVSPDGKTWQAEWRDYCWIEGAPPPDANTIEANPVKLVFKKLSLQELKQSDNSIFVE
jgi:hypothetical protein